MSGIEVIVVGYGNTLRTDDGFGPIVAERLSSSISDARVRVMVRQLLTVELVADLESVALGILIDASTDGIPGVLGVREIVPEVTEIGALGHDLSPAALIGLTQQFSGRAPKCILYSAVPESMELGEGLSAGVARLADRAVESIAERLRDYFARSPLDAER